MIRIILVWIVKGNVLWMVCQRAGEKEETKKAIFLE